VVGVNGAVGVFAVVGVGEVVALLAVLI